jgi:D-amino-acid dehydrogenase
MHVLVLGGGVIGVTTAYELLQDGHEVTLVERAADVALGTSFANAGMIAPGHAFAWASPKAPKILLRSLWRDDQALRFRFHADPVFWRWCLRFLGECTAERARINTQRKHRLCAYSQSVLHDIVAASGVSYDASQTGLLYFHRSRETFERGVRNMTILRDLGQAQQILTRDQIAELDPALAPVKAKIAGGIYSHTDETGDCALFTRALAGVVREKGAQVRAGTTVTRLETEGDRVAAVHTNKGKIEADRYVLALGVWSPHLMRGLDKWLPIYPVKGYSLTLPIGGNHTPPRVGAVDEDNLIAYSRLGDRLRVTATADFAGYDASHRPADFAVMTRKVQDILPGGADYTRPQMWAGLRPMTPEGTPVLGTGRLKNLYFNTGHGHVGWTMSCGAARVTRDLIAGRMPAIPLDGMTLTPQEHAA